MCIPAIAVAAVAVVASAVSTGLQVSGQVSAGKAAKAEADAQAMMAKSQAVAEGADARQELFQHGIASRRNIGTQEAIAAATNLDLTFGSARGILSDRYRFSAIDSINIGVNASRRSLALKNSAAAYKAYGTNARAGANLAAAGAAIGGVGSAISAGFSGYQLGSAFETK